MDTVFNRGLEDGQGGRGGYSRRRTCLPGGGKQTDIRSEWLVMPGGLSTRTEAGEIQLRLPVELWNLDFIF